MRLRNRYGLNTVLESVNEVPLKTWMDVGGSKRRVKRLLGVPADLLKIHLRYNAKSRTAGVISSDVKEEITPGVF